MRSRLHNLQVFGRLRGNCQITSSYMKCDLTPTLTLLTPSSRSILVELREPPLPIDQIPFLIKLDPFLAQQCELGSLILPARCLLPITHEATNETVGGNAAVTRLSGIDQLGVLGLIHVSWIESSPPLVQTGFASKHHRQRAETI